jgi:WD40 repeat protein
MLATTTHSDSGSLVWSPDHNKMAYITVRGLQAYVSDSQTDREQYITLSSQSFTELSWSPTSEYLSARCADGNWYVFRFDETRVWRVFRAEASSLEWLDDHQVLYVPNDGGLMLLDLRDIPHPVKLAG